MTSRLKKYRKSNFAFLECPKCNANIIEGDGVLICDNKDCTYCIESPPISSDLYDVGKDIINNAHLFP